jgi:hypothetical protein
MEVGPVFLLKYLVEVTQIFKTEVDVVLNRAYLPEP